MDKQTLDYVTPSFDEVDPFAAEQQAAEDKYSSLQSAKEQKIADLSIKNNASLEEDSYTQTSDGYLLSNKNKIYNDLYSGDLNTIFGEVQNQELTKNEDGQWGRFSQSPEGEDIFTPYEGSVRRLYGYNTDKGEFKLGLARGDLPSSDFRYIPGAAEAAGLPVSDTGYGWAPGPEGLNVDNKVFDIALPYETATAFEGLVHGNRNALDERLNMFTDEEERNAARDRFGSGASEYYTSQDAIFNPNYRQKSDEELKEFFTETTKLPGVQNPWEGYSEFSKDGIRIRNRYKMTPEERAAERYQLSQINTEEGTAMARIGNMVDAFQRTLFKEAALDFSDWVGEGLEYLTDGAIGWDNGTEAEKTQWVNDTFGFRPELANKSYQEAKVHADKITDALFDEKKDVEFEDIYQLVKIGITTPEMLGDSVGFIGSFFVPIAGWGGKAAKANKVINSINAAQKAGQISKEAAKAAVIVEKANINTLNKLRNFGQKNAGLMQVAAGNVNDQIDDYKQEFNADPSVAKVAQMMATETMLLGLDRFVDLSILKAPGALKGYKDAFKILEPKGKAKVLGKAVGVATGLASSMAKEAGQEYLQEIGQEFNVKFNFDKAGSFSEAIDEAGNVLLDKDLQAKGIMGAGLGAGGAVQFEGVGALGNLVVSAPNKIERLASAANKVIKGDSTRRPTETPETAEVAAKVDEIIAANKEARETTSNPAAAYYSGQGSSDPEIIQQARQEAREAEQSILEGSNSVFKSDEEFSVKLSRLDPLIEIAVAENPELTIEEIQRSVIKGLKAEGNQEQESQVAATVTKAHNSGLEFASIKPLIETAQDVESGTKGFITYFTRGKAALAEGNTSEYESNLEQLDNFYSYQSTKAGRFRSAIKELETTIENQVDILLKQGKAKSRKEALNMLNSTRGKSKVTVSHSDFNSETSEIRYSDVINKLLNPSYNKGIYRLTSTIENEAEAISNAYNSLLQTIGRESDTRPTETGASVPPSSSSVAPEVTPTAATPEVTVESNVPVSSTVEDGAINDFTDEELAQLEEQINILENDIAASSNEELSSIDDSNFSPMTDEELASLDDGSPVLENDFVPITDEELASLEEIAPEAETSSLEPTPVVEKEATVAAFNASRDGLKAVKKRITERRAELRASGVTTLEEVLQDAEMVELFAEKDRLENEQESTFVNRLKDNFDKRLKAFKSKSVPKFGFTNYSQKNKRLEVKTTIDKLISKYTPTGFTLANRNRKTANNLTKKFADKLLASMGVKDGEFNVGLGNAATSNPLTIFLFDENGKLNYNTVEAVQAASYEFLVQEASNLLGTNREIEDIADLFGISSESVTPAMYETFVNGGIILKLAAPSIGEKLINHLGIKVEGVQNKEALATAFGIAALRALEDDFILMDSFSEEGVFYGGSVQYVKGLPSMYYTAEESSTPSLYDARQQLTHFEETLGVDLDKDRTYRRTKTKGNRKVYIHKSEYQEAPKDHQDTVNRLENTPFSFNSGHDVLLELFADEEGNLDEDKLVERILGPESNNTNKDAKDRYEAQKEAVKRSIKFYKEAKEDVGKGSLFFNWFIAKNQRIHLDSNNINPQNDKNLARWLLTTNNSNTSIKKSDIENALNGKEVSNKAIMFIYGIVQAFDGADNVPGVDKNNQQEIIASAKALLENSSNDQLIEMAAQADHVGHAALAIANIRKYMDSDNTVDSDIVLEVDGLTNGFAFRAMQFPLGQQAYQWLEKVGVIRPDSKFYALESMNSARDMEQEDVYISVGSVFQDKIIEGKETLSENSKKWIDLFEEMGKLPNFADKDDNSVKKFVRNLMKSPVMIFNYAAGKEKIASGLINDQVMGTNYLSGKGLIDALTELNEDKTYVITEAKLKEVFGEELGAKYHKSREALISNSIISKTNKNVMELRNDLIIAVGGLYREALENTLSSLFSEQTEVNKSITDAGQLMFDYFKEAYDLWRSNNPEATEEEKTEYLRSIAQIVPGVAGASTDDQLNKVTFLKSVLEPTNNNVIVTVGGNKSSTNTISRAYGEPGVGPAVLLVLSSDSSTMAKTLNQAYAKKDGFGALPIHDAIILGASETSTISMYNLNFYSVNRNYSIMQEFVSAIEGLEKSDPNIRYKNIVSLKTDKLMSFADIKQNLLDKNQEVQAARKDLFDSELKIGQMVGPEGTMVTVNPEQMKEMAKKVVANASDSLLSRFKEKRVQKALGKDYTKALAKIEKMLEGCK